MTLKHRIRCAATRENTDEKWIHLLSNYFSPRSTIVSVSSFLTAHQHKIGHSVP